MYVCAGLRGPVKGWKMELHTLGRVVDAWSILVLPSCDEQAWFSSPPIERTIRRYYLRLVLLDPRTERTITHIVRGLSEDQWRSYPIGSWLRLRVRRWLPFADWFYRLRIDGPLAVATSAEHER
jgi:hypothetical protein